MVRECVKRGSDDRWRSKRGLGRGMCTSVWGGCRSLESGKGGHMRVCCMYVINCPRGRQCVEPAGVSF